MFSHKYRFGRQPVFTLSMLAFVFSWAGCALKTPEIFHVGILSGLNFTAKVGDGFKTKMTVLGYVEGRNIIYDHQTTDFDITMYKMILNRFVHEQVDLIFVFPTEATQEAKAAVQGSRIPVVFAIANIEDTGLVESVRAPGNNITGVRYPGPDIALQRFEILRELAPRVKRILIPYQRGYPIVSSQLDALRPVAAAAGITLVEAPAADKEELAGLLAARTAAKNIGVDAILALAEPLFVTSDAFVVMAAFADRHHIPIAGALMMAEGHESLFGLHVNDFNVGQQAASQAVKILKGIPAGSIPIVSADPYFQLNYRAVIKLGLHVSEGLLSRANEVIR
ncbi:ABC transporter substrate-binding protein [candidate division FCPU426 bacterium]|nr:ABC transporter substrate-binding protein [candidate division FCPU426 bacterium]